MNVPHVVYTFICQWTLGLFLPFDQCAQAAMNTGMQIPIWVLAFNSFVYTVYSELGFLDPVGSLCLRFWGIPSCFSQWLFLQCVFIFLNIIANTYHFLWIFFDMATLMSVKIALICISLRISEIEIFLCAHPFLKNINLPFRMNGGGVYGTF